MLKQEITEKISQFFKVTEFEAEKIFDDIFAKIIDGVKEDNIVDVVNFGEFIVKYDNGKNGGGSPYKKTIEFLASVNLEDEIGHKSYDLYKSPSAQTTVPVTEQTTGNSNSIENNKTSGEIKVEKSSIDETKLPNPEFDSSPVVTEKISNEPVKIEKTGGENIYSREHEVFPVSSFSSDTTHEETGPLNIEEEFKKKREALLNKISIHPLLDSSAVKSEQDIIKAKPEEFKYFIKEQEEKELPDKPEAEMTEHTEDIQKEKDEAAEKPKEEIPVTAGGEEKNDAIPESVQETAKSYYDEDISSKSFADYFTEINKDEHITPVSPAEEEKHPEPVQPLPQIIPPKAVELHKDITGTGETVPETPAVETPVKEEHPATDKSYYIWYKESEPNVSDTQTMSYEYELLYQATKEAEYKSKLKIYVSTFILFFSVVLALLIFSPVIYKIFFTPVEQQSFQNIDEQSAGDQVGEHKAELNVAPVSTTQNNPADTNKTAQNQTTQQPNNQTEQNTQQTGTQNQSTQNQNTQQTNTQSQQQSTEPSIEGVTKTSSGWSDDKYKVFYVKLDNSKYTIQESSWDSEEKANKRISIVDALKISDMKGSVAKTDLGSKGVWYRTRFGEFSTIEEARKKAAELKSR